MNKIYKSIEKRNLKIEKVAKLVIYKLKDAFGFFLFDIKRKFYIAAQFESIFLHLRKQK